MSKGPSTQITPQLCVMPATAADRGYLIEAFTRALAPYYEGNHLVHAERVLQTHLSGADNRGLLSTRQLLLVLWEGAERRGILNLVFKRQSTCKISPLILFPPDRNRRGLGTILMRAAEEEARDAGARNLYCTVAKSNHSTLTFFQEVGFVKCGNAPEQYKTGETEILLRKQLSPLPAALDAEDMISVAQVQDDSSWREVRKLLSSSLPRLIEGASESWLESMHRNAQRSGTSPKDEGRRAWIYAAQDRSGCCRAGAIVTYKKGGALKVLPIAARDIAAFKALIVDLPTLLFGCGRKAYLHHAPSAAEVAALQESCWKLEGLLSGAYREDVVTQQRGCPLDGNEPIRSLRIHNRYLSMIKTGQKRLEIRVAYDHIKKIRSGDLIRLVSNSDSDQAVRRVREVRRYAGLAQMLQHEDIEQVLPGLKPQEALQRLREIYPPEKERRGVVVLDLAEPNTS
jgi:ASC-1-like (ASCH) protein/ribosomal protein S18 acetylase RimI-like enzyme